MEYSVVIPVAGRPVLLLQALESVVTQSHPPSEICIVLDSPRSGDREKDREALEQFIEDYKTPLKHLIYSIEGPGTGPAAARNRGVLHSKMPWIAFLDSDDLWTPEKMAKQMKYLEKRPHLEGCQCQEKWMARDRILTKPEKLKAGPGVFLHDSLDRCMVSPSSVVCTRESFDQLGGFNESFGACEDFDLWIRWLNSFPMGFIPEELTIKRSGGWEQLSSAGGFLDALRIRSLLDFVETNPGTPFRKEALESARIKLSILKQGSLKRNRNDDAKWNDLEARFMRNRIPDTITRNPLD